MSYEAAVRYRELLTVSWWIWPLALAAAAVAATEIGMGAPGLRHPLTFAIAGGLVVAGLALLSRIRIRVLGEGALGEGALGKGEDVVLRVDDTRLPVDVIAAAVPLSAHQRQDLLGRDAHPLAFVIQRPWISGGVRIDLDDPDDPTPYWFISTRHPTRLAGILTEAARAARSGGR